MEKEHPLKTLYDIEDKEYIQLPIIKIGNRKYIIISNNIRLKIIQENGDFIELLENNPS